MKINGLPVLDIDAGDWRFHDEAAHLHITIDLNRVCREILHSAFRNAQHKATRMNGAIKITAHAVTKI